METRSNIKLPATADENVKDIQTQLRVLGLQADSFKGEENYSWLNSLNGGAPRLLKLEENFRLFEDEISNRLKMIQQTFLDQDEKIVKAMKDSKKAIRSTSKYADS